jgi:hypothetical protein
MRRALLTILALSAAFCLTAVFAGASVSYRTHISLDTASFTGHRALFTGRLESQHGRCIARRKVKLFDKFQGGGQKLIDTDRSSKNGAWSGYGRFPHLKQLRVRLPKKSLGRHRQCQAESALFDAR